MRATKGLAIAFFVCGLTVGTANAGVVAVLDTGVDSTNSTVASHVISGGYDFVNNDADPTDDNGHGTTVASVIVQTDSNAQILPIKVLDSTGAGTGAEIANGLNYVKDHQPQARVYNMSLGGYVSDVTMMKAVMQSVTQAGKILVMAAGNGDSNGYGYPSPAYPAAWAPILSGYGIVVGATNGVVGGGGDNYSIAVYSNRAGSAKDYYIVAPGKVDTGTQDGNGNEIYEEGTSFAAPQVAAAASMILDRAPYLSGAQVVQILLSTATDLGAPGVDSTYGHGLLNIQAALAPVGGVGVPTGSSSSSGTSALGVAALGVGAAIAYALLHRSQDIKKAMVLDSFGRPYQVDLSKLIRVVDDKPQLTSIFSSLRRETHYMNLQVGNNLKLKVYYSQPNTPSMPDPFKALDTPQGRDLNGNPQDQPDVAMSLQGGSAKGFSYRIDYNMDPRSSFGAMHLQGIDGVHFLTERALTTPYLSFGDTTNSAQLNYQLSDRAGVKFGVASTDEHTAYGRASTGAIIEGSYKLTKAATVKLQFGQLSENGSLFGGSNGGAFGVNNSETTSAGITGQYRIRPHLAVVGNYTQGYTRVADTPNSLLHNFSGIRSEAYGLGLIGDELFRKGDSFGLAVSRPLRVIQGSVTLDIPYARDYAGNIYKEHQRLSLKPNGQETDLEAYYQFLLGKNAQLGTYFLYQDQPYNTPDLKNRMTVYTTLSSEF